MIDPDALRQFAADLDAKVDACRLNAVGFAYRGNPNSARYCDGQADAYVDVAARIRVMLADEASDQEEEKP